MRRFKRLRCLFVGPCRVYGHRWKTRGVDTGMCMASLSVCTQCGSQSYDWPPIARRRG